MNNDPSPRLSLYLIRIPRPKASFWALLVLGTGIVAAFVVSLAIGFAIWVPAAEAAGVSTNFALAAGLAGGFLGPVLRVLVYSRFRRVRALTKTPLRDARLARIRKYEDAARRVPHRVAEYALRCVRSYRRGLKSTLPKIPTGVVVVAAHDQDDPMPPPRFTLESFEPIELNSTDLQAEWLLLSTWPRHDAELEEVDQGQQLGLSFRRGTNRSWITVPLSYLALLIAAVYVVHAMWTGDRAVLVFTAAILGPLLLGFIASLVRERRWWVIPGGIVERDAPFWRDSPTLRRFNAGQSPLVIDQRFNKTYVVHAGKVRKIPCQEYGQWLLLAAWISQARPPTDEELCSFFQTPLKVDARVRHCG